MYENPIIWLSAVGLLYLSAWAAYRYCRWAEYRTYLAAHLKERLDRATFDAKQLDYLGKPVISGDELVRRAKWDGQFGPLMNPLELKNREETRWPVSALFQVTASISSGLIIAMLIWGGKPTSGIHDASPPPPNLSDSGSSFSHWGDDKSSNESSNRIAPTATDPTLTYTLICVCTLFASGLCLLILLKTLYGRIIGILFLSSASVFSGLKFISVDKVSVGSIIEVKPGPPTATTPVDGKPPDAPSTAMVPSPFSFSFTLPSFESGSAQPAKNLRCALNTVAEELSADPTSRI